MFPTWIFGLVSKHRLQYEFDMNVIIISPIFFKTAENVKILLEDITSIRHSIGLLRNHIQLKPPDCMSWTK